MRWIKKGLIFKPAGNKCWSLSHAQVPLVELIKKDVWRIYYGTRDEQNRTLTSFIEVDANNPVKILYEHDQPVLKLGAAGFFDDSGVMPSEIINHNGKKYFFYVGWNTGNTARYRTALGLAIWDEEAGAFKKIATGPVMDRSLNDPVGVSCQSILVKDGKWKTWYMSYKKWQARAGIMEPFYEIKYAESEDGMYWMRPDITSIGLQKNEGGIACPSVIFENGFYKMWYSVRGLGDYRNDEKESYKIGYAESKDGKNWNRKDSLAGIYTSKTGWDSEMIAYPYVFRYKTKIYMFYNGNGFGRSGFGYAELER